MEGHHCALDPHHLQYLNSLYSYGCKVLCAQYERFIRVHQLSTHGAIAGTRAIRVTTFFVANLIISLAHHLIGFIAAQATYGLLFVVLAVAWQVYYPLRVTLSLISRLRMFSGYFFELTPPNHNQGQGRYVALTLNCGPSPYSTDAILAVLGKYNAQASFFVTSSQVEKCDAIGAGSGVEGLGKAILLKMLAEGHQLGALATVTCRQTCPTHTRTDDQLLQELLKCSKLIASAQRHHLQQAAASAHATTDGTAVLIPKAGPCKWFRPQGVLPTPGTTKAANELGYTAVLASVFPWDNIIKWPYLNALYVRSKVYTGAIIMLNDGPQLLPTLRHILPWLQASGYNVVALDTAAAMSRTTDSLEELTCNTLAAHNRAYSLGSSSSCDADVMIAAQTGSAGSPTQGHSLLGSSSSPAESPPSTRAQAEISKKVHLRETQRAEADRRAGIDRRLAVMSAAERRAASRRERERKEAEKRRTRRAAEERKAQESYRAYVSKKAEQQRLLEQEKAAAIDLWRQQSLDRLGTEVEEVQPAEMGEPLACLPEMLERGDQNATVASI